MPRMVLLPLNSCEVKGGRDSGRCGGQWSGWAIMALRALFFITLLLLADAQKWPVSGDCRPCECRYKVTSYGRMRTVNCSRRGLSAIPANLPDDLMALDLSWNSLDVGQLRVQLCKFQSLQFVSLAFADLTALSDILKECSSVLELNLTGNRLAQVDSKTFMGLKNLRRLLGLEVEAVARDIFKHLTNLKDLDVIFHGESLPKGLFDDLVIQSLNLVVTQANSLPQRVFEFGQKTLNTLQLIGERITQLDEDLLDGLRVLKKLYLVMPSVQRLPERFFQSQQFRPGDGMNNARLASLQEVEMSGIRSLPAMLFNKLVTLETLQLKEIGSFPQMGFLAGAINLRTLLVTGSTLTSLPEGWFSQLYSLETLTFSGLQLERLHENAFRGLISLTYLDLSNNNLDQITAKMLMPLNKSLETLILRGNLLTEINKDVLGKLGSLRLLDVGENRLTNVYTNTFMGMTYLSSLYLNNNRLTSLPKDLFTDLLQLGSLSLSDNYLVEFPEAILQLKRSLVNLDLASNELREMPAFQLCQFVYLETISILGNKLHCDCSLLAFQWCWKITVEGQCTSPEQYVDMLISDIQMPASCTEGKDAKQMLFNPQTEPPTFSSTQSPAVAVDSLVRPSPADTPEAVEVPPVNKQLNSALLQNVSSSTTDRMVSGNKSTQNATIVRELFTEKLRNKSNNHPALPSSKITEDKSLESQTTQKPVSVPENPRDFNKIPQSEEEKPDDETDLASTVAYNQDQKVSNKTENEGQGSRLSFEEDLVKPSKAAKNPDSVDEQSAQDTGKENAIQESVTSVNGYTLDQPTVEPRKFLELSSPVYSIKSYSEGSHDAADTQSENAASSSESAGKWINSDQLSPKLSSEKVRVITGVDSDFPRRKSPTISSTTLSSSGESAENKMMNRATSRATSVSSSLEPFAVLDIDVNKIKPLNISYQEPKGQEMDNNGSTSPEKVAFNFIISALAALSMFGCAVIGIICVRRWQQKGSYIISNEDTEMNNIDSGNMEAAAVLPGEKPKSVEVV